MIVISIACVMVYFRAFNPGDESQHLGANENALAIKTALVHYTSEEPDFHFLLGYLIELVLSLFLYTPIVQTVVFSGFLGCGRMPFLGGRPREMRNEHVATMVEV